ncbi:hypothetical protein PRIPAC_75073 [Pristionchus pacificus]|uniref:Uncharacterized protein n=1 Tax=Pristionchus pacificus TaxID=54126 RepID=A0A2A6B4R5_PRIPA|nr:hypothetical protein PRIPAC_75073 [Pristionchus pacificus]|eukprot:PDM60851.1 hypothetical protein PRIPAC_54657 [Pristionchus pacificus]
MPVWLITACVSISVPKRTIALSLSSNPIFDDNKVPRGFESIACKPVWEDGGLGMGLKRLPAGPWQTRRRLSERELLAVSTQVIVNGSDIEKPFLLLKYDWAVIRIEGDERSHHFKCTRGDRNKWNVTLPKSSHLPFPYFIGCSKDWRFEEAVLIDCNDLERMHTTTPVPHWVYYPMGRGAYYPPQQPVRKKIYQSKEEELDREDLGGDKHWHKRRKHRHEE